MDPKQKTQHTALVTEALTNRRASVIGELREQRAGFERSIRQKNIDPAFGRPEVAERAAGRIDELLIELKEVDGRMAAGV